jgi:hypothetical protein
MVISVLILPEDDEDGGYDQNDEGDAGDSMASPET